MTGPERLKQIAQSAEGFVYLLSVTGITGSQIKRQDAILQMAQSIRSHTRAPVALGFGIKSPADALPFLKGVDAFIVGSGIIEMLDGNSTNSLVNLCRDFRAMLEESE